MPASAAKDMVWQAIPDCGLLPPGLAHKAASEGSNSAHDFLVAILQTSCLRNAAGSGTSHKVKRLNLA